MKYFVVIVFMIAPGSDLTMRSPLNHGTLSRCDKELFATMQRLKHTPVDWRMTCQRG